MKLLGSKGDSNYQKCVAEARKWFEREDREKACYWYTKAGLAGRADADMRDLGDYLVVATEYRPEIAGEVARLILNRKGPIPAMYMQDVFCCALFVPDRALEQEAIRRVMADKITPTLCVRIADMYFEYGADRRDQVQAVLWVQRAAQAEAATSAIGRRRRMRFSCWWTRTRRRSWRCWAARRRRWSWRVPTRM
jgi:TPR repeat protein